MEFLKKIIGKIESWFTKTGYISIDEWRIKLKEKGLSSIEDLKRLVKPLILDATKIVVHPTSSSPDNSQMSSHFGGSPYFERGETWPVVNEKNLEFICQFHDLEGRFLPDGIRLVQFYYDFDQFPYDTDQQGWLVKTYKEVNVDKTDFLEKPKELKESRYCEVSFERVKSLPDEEEIYRYSELASALSNVLDDDKDNHQGLAYNCTAYESVVTKLIGEQHDRSQIGGYPQWIQPAGTHNNANNEAMKLLMQIGSEDNAGLMWGDNGSIYVFYDHKNIADLGFELQCY